MLVGAAAVGLAGIGVGAAGTFPGNAQVSARPTPIRETFTALPCPKNPVTTLEIEGCLEQKVLQTDRAIDSRVQTIFRLLRPTVRPSFLSEEKLWLAERRSFCSADSSRSSGGTLRPIHFAECVVRLNRKHIKALDERVQALGKH